MTYIEPPRAWRQSRIARFDACSMSLLFELTAPRHGSGPLAARGVIFHRVVARLLSEMRMSGEESFPVELALVVLNEEIVQAGVEEGDYVQLKARDIEWLRVLVTRWCENVRLDPSRIVAVEERMFGTVNVSLPGGASYEREFSGQADVVVADPPNRIIIPDWKSGFMPPARKREREDGNPQDDRLSDHGYPQQVIYGLLVLQNYPAVETVTLREFYVLFGEFREASIHRYQQERLQDILAGVIAQMDAAVAEGEDSQRWLPTAGTHCTFCPSPRSCPIQEWAGIPADEEEAKQAAREWIVAGRVRTERAEMVKGWVDGNGPVEIENAKGRREVGWVESPTPEPEVLESCHMRVECKKCGAPIGSRCIRAKKNVDFDPNAEPLKNPHYERWSKLVQGVSRRFTLYEPQNAPDSPFEERLEVPVETTNAPLDFGEDPPF